MAEQKFTLSGRKVNVFKKSVILTNMGVLIIKGVFK